MEHDMFRTIKSIGTTVAAGVIFSSFAVGALAQAETQSPVRAQLLTHPMVHKVPNKCVNIHFVITPKGDENDVRVSGCGATPNLNPTPGDLQQWLTLFTDVAPKPSLKGNMRFCAALDRTGNDGTGNNTFRNEQIILHDFMTAIETSPAAFTKSPATQGDFKHFVFALLSGNVKQVRHFNKLLFHDCNWDS